MIFQKKFSVNKLKSKKAFFLSLPLLFSVQAASASTSLMASGHAGFVGQFSFETPPMGSKYEGFRVPVGLTLQASPSDNFSLFIALDYAYNNYPGPSVLLGQTTSTSQGATANANPQTSTPLPFSNSINGTTPFSQKTDVPLLTQAYFSYQSSFGVLRAGRLLRNWGLGVWQSAEWTPFSPLPSTSDSVSLYTDFNAFDISIYYDKFGTGVGGTSVDSTASSFTIEAKLKAEPADSPSSGVSREFGVAFSKFSHPQSNTSINILDFYQKFYASNFFAGSEFLYPSGSTQSPNYQSLGGATACTATNADAGVVPGSQTCVPQDFSAFGALVKLKYKMNGNDNSSIAATEKSQKLMGTSERETSHILGLWGGYASGGENQFAVPGSTSATNRITALLMNPSVQPSFLMFNNTMPAINGMPGGAITNTTFVRLNYTFESPEFGSIEPVIVWGMLNKTNKTQLGNAVCANRAVNPNSSSNVMCLGHSKHLGVELDVSYRYTTLDRVTFGVDAGYWFVGKAWDVDGGENKHGNIGVRTSVAMSF